MQSWQIARRLSKKHGLFGTKYSKFDSIKKIYQNKFDLFSFFRKVDVVFTIVDGFVDLYNEKFTFLAKLFGVPTVWLLNSPIEEVWSFTDSKLAFYKQKLFRSFAAKFVDHAICISSEMEVYAREELGIKNTSVMSNGADHVLFDPRTIKTKGLLAKSYFKILWSGNGEFTWQALDLIIALAKKLEKKHPDIMFVVVSSSIWTNIEKPKNIIFLHSVSYSLLPSYIAQADVCLCLYHTQDGLAFYRSPMKLFDYMAMAKPVIASNFGQIKEVLADGNGFLVENNLKRIEDMILYLKSHKKVAKKAGERARQAIVHTYNWDLLVPKIDTIISRVSQSNKKSS